MTDEMTPTDWNILRELEAGTLQWGAAVAACWPLLVRRGYAEPNFGGITELGRAAVRKKALAHD